MATLHSLNFAAPERPNVQADDLMSEGGRKVMAFHFGRLLTKQAEVLASDNGEAVHQMRVATRRLRSTLRIFRPYYRQSVLRPFRRALRAVADALGNVRDLDVYREHLASYTKQQPAASRRELRLLSASLAVPHAALRQSLCDYLLSEAHTEFLSAFAAFVQTPLAGVRELEAELPVPQRVCEVVPRLIYEQYGIVRAYAPLLSTATPDQLHALRIEVKQLRYLIEAFGELLGTRAELPVEACKQLQDFLGELQDTEVAGQLTAHYLPNVQRGKRALQRYLSTRHAQGERLRTTLAEQWSAFSAPAVREALALAVAAL
ncbi:CHAD domain-containing protein [Chloroflexi bacterium CFX3]|nr:CHAD domain-containing protein [Chloroflexi bacterium CFX3]